MAHYLGMKISRVLAGGKKYHADLNASYNIGARFFIRAAIKSLYEKKRLALWANVPEVLVRTQQTLSTLYKFVHCRLLSCVDRLGIESRYFVYL